MQTLRYSGISAKMSSTATLNPGSTSLPSRVSPERKTRGSSPGAWTATVLVAGFDHPDQAHAIEQVELDFAEELWHVLIWRENFYC